MKAERLPHTIQQLIDLRRNSMLRPNPEYQRGAVWSRSQQKKLIDSVLRGYPLPVVYLHHIKRDVGAYSRDDFEIIDGQQRINAIWDFHEGAFDLYDVKDEQARFPAFIRNQPCEWAGKGFEALPEKLRKQFLATEITVALIDSPDTNEVRDLFVRLQSGLPLNHQETRDAWPGNFTEFVLKLGGKPEVAKYPGHPFFTKILGMKPGSDRGKTRQLSAQLAALFIAKREGNIDRLTDINAEAINSMYYDNLDFDLNGEIANRLRSILDKLTIMLGDGKRPKLRAHDAIHAVLLVDSLLDDYAPVWQDEFPTALDSFLSDFVLSKQDNDAGIANPFWTQYGQWTRVNSDRGDIIVRRHKFYTEMMLSKIENLKLRDPNRIFGEAQRSVLYFSQSKQCAVCEGSVKWGEFEVHHVEEHSAGGPTALGNGAIVHFECHPKGVEKTAAFALKWAAKQAGQKTLP